MVRYHCYYIDGGAHPRSRHKYVPQRQCYPAQLGCKHVGSILPHLTRLLVTQVTCGDDCIAIKGNSTNIHANGVVCRGGNGIAFGSLGQYTDLVRTELRCALS